MGPINKSERNAASLRRHFSEEAGPVNWIALERFFASGHLIEIDQSLDLIEVATQMALNNTEQIKAWMEGQLIRRIEDDLARNLMHANAMVKSVISRPWVLMQQLHTPHND